MRRPIDPVDTIWLNMDRPNNVMVIESLMTFAEPMDWERLLVTYRERVLDRYPVFRQRPVFSRVPLLPPHWEDDEAFDLARHVRYVTLGGEGGDRDLQDYVNGHFGRPLDRDRPLWEIHLIDGYQGGSAVYSRLHHALADGIALLQVLLSLTDGEPEPSAAGAGAAAGPEPLIQRDGVWDAAVHAAGAAGGAILDLTHLVSPHLVHDALTVAQQSASVAAKLTLSHRPRTALVGTAGEQKCAVWAPPFPLAEVAEVGHRTGTTVNDVLVAALAGAVAAYLREHDGEAVDLPTMVPVNLRGDAAPPSELGNKFALVLLSLPSGLDTPFARLAETKRRMDAIKHSPEAVLTFGMIRGIGRTGRDLERYLVDFFADKASGVTTNVPGPRAPRYVAGRRVASMLGWAPQSGNQTLGTCIFTYDGNVHVGFKTDAATVAHPERLVEAFQEELRQLVQMAPATS
ncbi:wax ester/triacylglycerol synthase family O-acyltransferase [Nocardioides sp.]|uniref:wax ester/triacylglycerol synthase family O-acyltransferase n=1 Tax=Nocardioides sp. TaxID=35761 RepID=UPI001A343108|nr:wax ester/triacylglycerol synthase family O-acyltransferase [Nocardioides sp.]MBJ7358390.1 wax ester/triacylglycerol synthase family O-acyltransferase [Nocardioides sp.]